ncbi:MAG: hypothetical protein FD120_2811, partial [Gammaproteobacteria bacterium]
ETVVSGDEQYATPPGANLIDLQPSAPAARADQSNAAGPSRSQQPPNLSSSSAMPLQPNQSNLVQSSARFPSNAALFARTSPPRRPRASQTARATPRRTDLTLAESLSVHKRLMEVRSASAQLEELLKGSNSEAITEILERGQIVGDAARQQITSLAAQMQMPVSLSPATSTHSRAFLPMNSTRAPGAVPSAAASHHGSVSGLNNLMPNRTVRTTAQSTPFHCISKRPPQVALTDPRRDPRHPERIYESLMPGGALISRGEVEVFERAKLGMLGEEMQGIAEAAIAESKAQTPAPPRLDRRPPPRPWPVEASQPAAFQTLPPNPVANTQPARPSFSSWGPASSVLTARAAALLANPMQSLQTVPAPNAPAVPPALAPLTMQMTLTPEQVRALILGGQYGNHLIPQTQQMPFVSIDPRVESRPADTAHTPVSARSVLPSPLTQANLAIATKSQPSPAAAASSGSRIRVVSAVPTPATTIARTVYWHAPGEAEEQLAVQTEFLQPVRQWSEPQPVQLSAAEYTESVRALHTMIKPLVPTPAQIIRQFEPVPEQLSPAPSVSPAPGSPPAPNSPALSSPPALNSPAPPPAARYQQPATQATRALSPVLAIPELPDRSPVREAHRTRELDVAPAREHRSRSRHRARQRSPSRYGQHFQSPPRDSNAAPRERQQSVRASEEQERADAEIQAALQRIALDEQSIAPPAQTRYSVPMEQTAPRLPAQTHLKAQQMPLVQTVQSSTAEPTQFEQLQQGPQPDLYRQRQQPYVAQVLQPPAPARPRPPAPQQAPQRSVREQDVAARR